MKKLVLLIFLFTFGASAQRFVSSFPTIEAMVTAPPQGAQTNFNVLGYYSPGDGGGGNFYYSGSSAATTNYGSHIKPSTFAGRYIRIFPGYISPKMFGAKGNYSPPSTGQDDTVYFQEALNYSLSTGRQFKVDPGIYQTTATLTVSNLFSANIDFGNHNPEKGSGGATIMYLNATNVPFMTLIDPTRFVIENLSLYIKPMNGWNLSDIISEPQQNTNAYAFRIYGWGTFMTIQNMAVNYGSGFVQNIDDAAYTTRGEARLFNCDIRNVDCRYGDWAFDLSAGSGSTWENIYVKSSSGGYTNQTAMGALRYRTFINNETWNRLNIEWSAFKKSMIDLNSAEIMFNGLHVEGVDFPNNYSQYVSRTSNVATFRTTTPHGYVTGQSIGRNVFTDSSFNGSGTVTVIDENTFTAANSGPDVATTADSSGLLWRSTRWWIEQTGGSLAILNSRFQDIRANWGYVTKQGMFYWDGGPRTSVNMQNVKIDQLNPNADGETYKLVRYVDYSDGAQNVQADQLDESGVLYWTNSPSWYGFDERRLPSSKRTESFTGFESGLNPFNVYYNGTPPAISYLNTATNAVGFVRMQSGTNNFRATLLQNSNAGVYPGAGVHRMKVRFRFSGTPSSVDDEYIFRVGFFTDKSSAPADAPADGVYLESRYSTYSDDRIYIVGRASSVQTTGTFLSASNVQADRWYEVELIFNTDRSQFRAYLNPRQGDYAGNVTLNLPAATTELKPQVQWVKRGATPVTNFNLDVDYVDVYSAPNGIY